MNDASVIKIFLGPAQVPSLIGAISVLKQKDKMATATLCTINMDKGLDQEYLFVGQSLICSFGHIRIYMHRYMYMHVFTCMYQYEACII